MISLVFDLDGTLAHTWKKVEKMVNEEFGINFRYTQYHARVVETIKEPCDVTNEVNNYINSLYANPLFYSDLEFDPDISELIKNRVDGKTLCFIVTSRPLGSIMFEVTRDYCLKNFNILPLVCGSLDGKIDFISHLSRSHDMYPIYFDDDPSAYDAASKCHIPVYIVTREYNIKGCENYRRVDPSDFVPFITKGVKSRWRKSTEDVQKYTTASI